MPVYNAAEFVREAIDSILKQDYQNFEFIIINDGSTDASVELITSFNDERLRLIENDGNRGLAYSINHGLRLAQGKYIARMDADDICAPNRISKQVKFMEKNPEIGISGTWMQSFGASSFKKKYPVSPEECRINLLFEVPLGHPSVIFRRELVDRFQLYYDEKLETYGEDYELWTRFNKHTKIANQSTFLVQYRAFPENTKKEVKQKRIARANTIRKQELLNWGISFNQNNLKAHQLLSIPIGELTISFEQVVAWCDTIQQYNRQTHTYDHQILKRILNEKLFLVAYHHPSWTRFKVMLKSPSIFKDVNVFLLIKFWLKLLLK